MPRESLFVFEDKLLFVPFDLPPSALGLRIVSLGVEIGEFAKGRLKPSHTFFMAEHGLPLRNRIELTETSGELAAFLRGETIESDMEFDRFNEYSRYMPVCVRSCPVGFGKLSDGVIKNHLPKGLVNTRLSSVSDE